MSTVYITLFHSILSLLLLITCILLNIAQLGPSTSQAWPSQAEAEMALTTVESWAGPPQKFGDKIAKLSPDPAKPIILLTPQVPYIIMVTQSNSG